MGNAPQQTHDIAVNFTLIPFGLTHTANQRLFGAGTLMVMVLGRSGLGELTEARYHGVQDASPVFRVVSDGRKAKPRMFSHYARKGWDDVTKL